MKIAIHQPHYFPWLGYLQKMAIVDCFIVLDEAQIEKGSNMYRNKLCTYDGKEKYITVAYEKDGCLEKKYNQIRVDNSIKWQERQVNFIYNNYRKTPFYQEVWDLIEPVFMNEFQYLCDVVKYTMEIEKNIFEISTEIIFQSDLQYDKNIKKNDMLIEICKEVGAKQYLSGNGARKYMDVNKFTGNGIAVEYQKFQYPIYDTMHEFVSNLSVLDMLFNCGVTGAKNIFWEKCVGNALKR